MNLRTEQTTRTHQIFPNVVRDTDRSAIVVDDVVFIIFRWLTFISVRSGLLFASQKNEDVAKKKNTHNIFEPSMFSVAGELSPGTLI